jgi:hypothetical protein
MFIPLIYSEAVSMDTKKDYEINLERKAGELLPP